MPRLLSVILPALYRRAALYHLLSSVVPASATHCVKVVSSPSPLVPSWIIWRISVAGHGLIGLPSGLQEPFPSALCIKPGLAWPQAVVGARTQPLDSCIIMARMNSFGTPETSDSDSMLSLMACVSASLLLSPQPLCLQEPLMKS